MDRGERRFRTKKKQEQRQQRWKEQGWEPTDKKQVGMLRDHNFSCGCPMCKPWKHGIEHELKPSEQRKIDDEQD